MVIELRQATAEDVPELGRVCYEAFKDIAESHGFPTDFESVEFAQGVIGMLVRQEDVYSVAAYDGDAAKGSNFINMWGEAAGLGPISVDLSSQGDGVGRRLMEDGIAQARKQGHESVRLCQDAFNMRSLALYSSLGFDTKEPLAYMALSDAAPVDPAYRPATAEDIPAMDELCRSVYRISRKAECEVFLTLGFQVSVLDRGHIAGYLIGGAAGHGVAETNDDLLALLAGSGAAAPNTHTLVPLRNGDLYRNALAAGHRNTKVMNLMVLGPYDEPQGPFVPSVFL